MPLSQRRTRLLGRLRHRKSRERTGLVLVEGIRATAEALDAGVDVSFVVTSARLEGTDAGRELRARLSEHDLVTVRDDEIAELSDTRHPQGVMLVCHEPQASLEQLPGRRFLVLDAVQDPGNVGTLIRSAVAFGLDGVLCLEGTADPWGPKTVRASTGMVFRSTVLSSTVAETLEYLAEREIPILIGDAAGDDVERRRGTESFALVVGNEGAGVRPTIRAVAGGSASVRMPGPAESLNAGMAGSILVYTLAAGDTRA